MMKIKIKQPNNKGSHQHTMINTKEIQIIDEKDIVMCVYSVHSSVRRFQ